MPVYQINLYACDICGHVQYTTATTFLGCESEVAPPYHEEWGIITKDDAEFLACPACQPAIPDAQTAP